MDHSDNKLPKPTVRLLNSGLSEIDGEIIAQGFLDTDSMRRLKVGDYQREFLKRSISGRRSHIERALQAGIRLPSIVVGMRGQSFNSSKETMYLEDPCYIVDGLQRVYTCLRHVEANAAAEAGLLLGAEVRFNTTNDSEKALFHALNSYRTGMSGNVLLRNMRDTNKAILTLYGLSMSEPTSPIYKKVQWNQRMQRGELFTAMTVAFIGVALHTPGSFNQGGVNTLATALDNLVDDSIGYADFRANVRSFFETMEDCFTYSSIEFVQKATVIKGNFLKSIAQLFAKHTNFWQGNKLVVNADLRRKLSSFPTDDLEVMRLAGAGHMAQPILYNLIFEHMNKGKRVHHLKPRNPRRTIDENGNDPK
jgi:hypothetical protein